VPLALACAAAAPLALLISILRLWLDVVESNTNLKRLKKKLAIVCMRK